MAGEDSLGPVVALDQGEVRGTLRDGVARFLAIPYAAAPIENLCCVNINYRLGILGFLAHPELDEEAEGVGSVGSGNYAILDQIFALQWIQRNISSFGGDPKNVTIWGLSSGAQYVSTLLISPAAQGRIVKHPQIFEHSLQVSTHEKTL
eukprot:Skav205185  [mRNA]  locus=scaffold1333:108843:109877:+ [translate_table: standard]